MKRRRTMTTLDLRQELKYLYAPPAEDMEL